MCLVHPRIQLGLLAARAYCWLIVNLLLIRTIKSCSMGSFITSPACQSVLTGRVALPVQNMPLLSFILLVIAQPYNLSRCLQGISSMESAAPPSLVEFAGIGAAWWVEVWLWVLRCSGPDSWSTTVYVLRVSAKGQVAAQNVYPCTQNFTYFSSLLLTMVN